MRRSNETFYQIHSLISKGIKKRVSFDLDRNEKNYGRETDMNLVFKIWVKYNPATDDVVNKKAGRKIPFLHVIKRRLVKLILEAVVAESTHPAIALQILKAHILQLWQWELYDMLPEVLTTARELARQIGDYVAVSELTSQLETAEMGTEGVLVQETKPDIVLFLDDLRKADQVNKAKQLFYMAEQAIAISDAKQAREILSAPLLNQMGDIHSFVGRIFAYRAALKCNLILKDWKQFCKLLGDVVAVLDSKENIYHPQFMPLLPEYLYQWGHFGIHTENESAYNEALSQINKKRRVKSGYQKNYNLAYHKLRLMHHLTFKKSDDAQTIVDIILAEMQADGQGGSQLPPDLIGTLATHYYHQGDWKKAVKYCSLYLVASPHRYDAKLCFWIIKIICHHEAKQFDVLGKVAKDAIADLGTKNLRSMEKSLLDIFKSATIKTHPETLRQNLLTIAPKIKKSLSEGEYVTMETTMQLGDWLTMLQED